MLRLYSHAFCCSLLPTFKAFNIYFIKSLQSLWSLFLITPISISVCCITKNSKFENWMQEIKLILSLVNEICVKLDWASETRYKTDFPIWHRIIWEIRGSLRTKAVPFAMCSWYNVHIIEGRTQPAHVGGVALCSCSRIDCCRPLVKTRNSLQSRIGHGRSLLPSPAVCCSSSKEQTPSSKGRV